MRVWCSVLIAAVTVNCLVTAINAKSTSSTVIEPFNMLLPPPPDKAEDVAKTTKAPATAATTTTAPSTKKLGKPLTNNGNTVALPELSIEALLPPLLESNIEKAENAHKQQTAAAKTEKTTVRTTTKPTSSTTTRTTARTTTTTKAPKPTTTAKSLVAAPPSLFLDALLPPLESDSGAASTAKPELTKTTKKPYYQQPKPVSSGSSNAHSKSAPQTQHSPVTSKHNKDKQLPLKPTANKHVADAKTSKAKAIPQHIISNIESMATQHIAKQIAYMKQHGGSSPPFNNYSFDLYLGSTTPRPVKYGLPTITPFPHRLGR